MKGPPLDRLAKDKFFIMDNFYMELPCGSAEFQEGDIPEHRNRVEEDAIRSKVAVDSCTAPGEPLLYKGPPNGNTAAASTDHTAGGRTRVDMVHWVDTGQEQLRGDGPVTLELCKGPYELAKPGRGQSDPREGRSLANVRPRPATGYCTTGAYTRMVFSRSKSGTLIFRPPDDAQRAALNAKFLSTKYILPNRRGVSFTRRGAFNAA